MFAENKNVYLANHVLRGLVTIIRLVVHVGLISHTQTLYPKGFCIS